jgi:hypothetical protein
MNRYSSAAIAALAALWAYPLAAQPGFYSAPVAYATPVYPAPPAASASPQGHGAEKLVPCQFANRADSQGFNWDVEQMGCVQQGTDSCFNRGFFLMTNVNGRNWQFGQNGSQAMMTADGREYVIQSNSPGPYLPLDVTRRTKVDPKGTGIRFVDVFHNTGAAPLTVGITIHSNLGSGQYQSLMTDAGSTTAAALGKKETGMVLFGQPNSGQLSVALFLAGATSKIKPTFSSQNQMQFILSYNLSIPAGKTAAIAYGAAQCRLAAPPDAKAVATLLKPFSARSWVRDLPGEIRKAIANLRGSSLDDDWDDDGSAFDLASLEIVQGATDLLALGSQTRMKGTATCSTVTLQTRYGPVKTALNELIAVIGPRRAGLPSHVVFRDGQVLSGKLAAADLKFTTHTGLEIALKPESIDRLVMRAGAEAKKQSAEVFAMLQTVDGERLALVRGEKQPLWASTPWGRLSFSVEEIDRLSASSEELGHRIRQRDGTRMFGYLDPANLTLPTLTFGRQSFSPLAIREIRALPPASGYPKTAEEGHDAPAAAHVVLTGENILLGRVDASTIEIVTAGQKIAVPPGQIRHLRAGEADDAARPEANHNAGNCEGELWDGSTFSGRIATMVLPVRSGSTVWQIPVRDIVEIHVPTPTMSEATRTRIGELIRDLGHPEYEKRKAASAALADLGLLAKPQLSEAARQTADPEVRRSAETLLEDMKE